MAKSVLTSTAEAASGVLGSVTALAGVISKNAAALNRASDASMGYADTYVRNAELRNQGSIKDTVFDEQKRDHERLEERFKFAKRERKFYEEFPEAMELLKAAEPVPTTTTKTKRTTAR